MPPPFWIHCNICNALLNKENKHYLLSCTHILCKTCMKSTNGKKCPLDNNEIRFEDMSKLPEKLKNNFQPNLKNLFNDPRKIIDFQQNHLRNMAKLTREYKAKSCQAAQLYEKEKQEIIKIKSNLDAIVKQRRQMQEKLKKIYMQNKMKRQHEIYRNPANSTLSSGISSEKILSSIYRNPSTANSEFFNKNSPMRQKSSSNDFFRSRPSSSNKRASTIEHTQSERTPFFV